MMSTLFPVGIFFVYLCHSWIKLALNILINKEALCLACDRKPEKFSNEHKRGHSGSHAMAWAAISTPFRAQRFSQDLLSKKRCMSVPRFFHV